MYGHTEKKCSILTSGRPRRGSEASWSFMQAYGLITHMGFREVPLSYRIKDPGADRTANKQFFFGEDGRAFNAPQTRLGGVWKQTVSDPYCMKAYRSTA